MNSVLCRVTDAAMNECLSEAGVVHTNAAPDEELYTTAPMAVVQPVDSGEEELHTLFESAISSRLLAMREQMDRISGPLPHYTQQRRYETDMLLPVVEAQSKKALVFHNPWQRTILFGSLGLMLTMLGFDLMGLLVLYAR